MHVTINGEPQTVAPGLTVTNLINELGLTQRRVAIEINREVITREQYGTRILAEGDLVEVVHFVGGG